MAEILDQWTMEKDGIKYRIDVLTDDESSPDDADCYSPTDKEAFDNGLWRYVGVVVTPLIDGLDQGEGQAHSYVSASLWGVEYGTMPAEPEPYEGGQHGETVIDRERIINDYPVPDLITEARGELVKLRDKLNGLNLKDD